MDTMRRLPAVLIVAMALALATPPIPAADGCDADIRARLFGEETRDEVVIKTFSVEIDTRETCATVFVDLTVTERSPTGQEATTVQRASWKITGGHVTHKVDHRMPRDATLLDWKFEVTRCAACNTM